MPEQAAKGFKAATIEEVLCKLLEDEMRWGFCGGPYKGGGGGSGSDPSRWGPQYATVDDMREADLFLSLVQRASGPVIVTDGGDRNQAALVALSPRAFECLLFDRFAAAALVAHSGLRAPQGAW